MSRAVKNINEKISEALIDMDPALQSQIDQAMIALDKTENKVVGDDLLMSNLKRIERTLHESSCNALLLKVKIGGQPDQSCKVFHLPALYNLLLIVGGLKSETPFVLSI